VCQGYHPEGPGCHMHTPPGSWHATIIPPRKDPLSSELGSQPGLGCISTGDRDDLGTRSVVVFFFAHGTWQHSCSPPLQRPSTTANEYISTSPVTKSKWSAHQALAGCGMAMVYDCRTCAQVRLLQPVAYASSMREVVGSIPAVPLLLGTWSSGMILALGGLLPECLTCIYTRRYPHPSSFGTSVKIGTIQRRLAWPPCRDDTQNRDWSKLFLLEFDPNLHCTFYRLAWRERLVICWCWLSALRNTSSSLALQDMSFDGVVGYHVRLTRERSPVRTWVEAFRLVSSVG
jgi:hypothetical protein